jgi:hypothetical protein
MLNPYNPTSLANDIRAILTRKYPRGYKPSDRPLLLRRIAAERRSLVFAQSVKWDREQVIGHLLAGVSGWLGREVFEQSYDDGSMRIMAETYDRVAAECGV